MKEQAIRKINEEMQKNPSDRYTEIIGHYIIDRCADAQDAAKVAKDGKTLKGAMDAVRGLAKKKKKGDVAVLTPGQVFGEVDAYFGLQQDMQAQMKAMLSADGAPVQPTLLPAATVERPKGRLSLEDFL